MFGIAGTVENGDVKIMVMIGLNDFGGAGGVVQVEKTNLAGRA